MPGARALSLTLTHTNCIFLQVIIPPVSHRDLVIFNFIGENFGIKSTSGPWKYAVVSVLLLPHPLNDNYPDAQHRGQTIFAFLKCLPEGVEYKYY